VKENVDRPDSYLDAYRKWEKQKKHEVVKVPIPESIRSVSALPGPMICNWLPSQTNDGLSGGGVSLSGFAIRLLSCRVAAWL
jgi:hypothetical protein